MADLKSIEVQKIHLLRNILRKGLNGNSDESVFISLRDLEREPLLKNQMGFQKTLELISEASRQKITWRERSGMIQPPITTANDNPSPRGPVLIGYEVHFADRSKFEEYFKQIEAVASGKRFNPNKIEAVELLHSKGDLRIEIALNEQIVISKKTNKPLNVSIEKGRWKILFEVAEDKRAIAGSPKQALSVANYFNTNETCPLYTNTKYQLTEILAVRDDALQAAAGIAITVKDPRTVTRRKNKALKST